jgi:tetratricopeptide (TPR) repeat protein
MSSAAYIGKGEFKAALADATAAIELDPNCALAYYLKSVAYARLGDAANTYNNAIVAGRLGLTDPEASADAEALLDRAVTA